jgi:hypothetical protein
MHNQPDAPTPSSSTSGENAANSRRSAPGPPKPPSPPPPPLNPGQDESNVGNKLLKMMGWTEGTGLGTNGEGRVDPMYVGPLFPFPSLTVFADKQPSTHKVWDSVHPKAKTSSPYPPLATLRTITLMKWHESDTMTLAEIGAHDLLGFWPSRCKLH